MISLESAFLVTTITVSYAAKPDKFGRTAADNTLRSRLRSTAFFAVLELITNPKRGMPESEGLNLANKKWPLIALPFLNTNSKSFFLFIRLFLGRATTILLDVCVLSVCVEP